MINYDDIKFHVNWFYSLEHHKQIKIIDFINNKVEDLSELSNEDKKMFESFINTIKELIIDEAEDIDIVSKLIEFGFDKITAKSLYEFCKIFVMPYVDAKIVSNMRTEQLDSAIKFIINNIILYKNFDYIPFSVFVQEGDFESTEQAKRVLRFISSFIEDVCNRDISPKFLAEKIHTEYKIPSLLNEIIISNIENNLREMQQAHLLLKVNELLSKFSNLSCTTESCLNKYQMDAGV